MASNFLKKWYLLVVICTQLIVVKSELSNPKLYFNFTDFERVKYELFNNHFNISIEIDEKCHDDLEAIQNGLGNSKKWAFESMIDLHFGFVKLLTEKKS